VEGFDFTTAKSVAHLTRSASGRLSMPNMEANNFLPRPEEPITKLSKRSTLRSSSSMNNLQASDRLLSQAATNGIGQVLDDAAIHDSFLTCCPPCLPGKKKGFELPRLVIRDKVPTLADAQVLAAPAPAVEAAVQQINEACTPEAELTCTSRCSIDEGKKLVLDIPRLNWKLKETSKPHHDSNEILPAIPSLGLGLKYIKIDSPQLAPESIHHPRPTSQSSDPSGFYLLGIPGSGIARDSSEPSQKQTKASIYPATITLPRGGSMVTDQIDIFESSDIHSEIEISSASGSIISLHHPHATTETNSSQPSVVSEPWVSSNSLPRVNARTPSLLSEASRNSVYRHALLKPSVTTSQLIDLGLPVQRDRCHNR
jgi:hypothetical protein